MTNIRKIGSNKTGRLMSDTPPSLLDFIFSDGSIDAYDDVIDLNGWDLYDFLRNPIALLSHNLNFPIGRWENVRVADGALRGHLKLAPEGASSRIDEVRALIHAGILKSCSVGFYPVESMPRPGSKRGGVRYIRQRLTEVSVVSVPANSNALLETAKALGTSDAVMKAIFFRPSKDASLAERQAHARASLARARELIARVDARMRADEGAANERKPGELGPKAQAICEQHKARRERELYAIPREQNRWPGEPSPSLMFCGKPIYRKKGPCGW